MKKSLSIITLFLVLAVVGFVLALPKFYVVPVMMYHNIAQAKNELERANSVSPESFKRQMAFLKKNGYRILSVDEYIDGVKSGKKFCCNSVVITFDDGLLSNYTQALPVLAQHGFPAAFFIGTNDVGDDMQMSWPQLKEAAMSDVTIGSHLLNEAYLPDIPSEQRRQEIVESKKIIEEKLGRPALYLAYPSGGFNEEVVRMVQEAGYRAAFTTNRGKDKFNRNLYEINRIRFNNGDSDLVLWAKLSGYYNSFRKPKNPF